MDPVELPKALEASSGDIPVVRRGAVGLVTGRRGRVRQTGEKGLGESCVYVGDGRRCGARGQRRRGCGGCAELRLGLTEKLLLRAELRLNVQFGQLKGCCVRHQGQGVRPPRDGRATRDRDAGGGGADVQKREGLVTDMPGVVGNGGVQDADRVVDWGRKPDLVQSARSAIKANVRVSFQAWVTASEGVDSTPGQQANG